MSIGGSVAVLRPKKGGQIVNAIVPKQEPSLLPICLTRDVELGPTTLTRALASQHYDVVEGRCAR